MNTRQLRNVWVALGVVVCFSISSSLALGKKPAVDSQKVVSPQALLANIIDQEDSKDSTNEQGSVLVDTLNEQLKEVQVRLDARDAEFNLMHKILADLARKDPESPVLAKIKEVEDSLTLHEQELKVLKKANQKASVINNNIVINSGIVPGAQIVGLSTPSSQGVLKSFTSLFNKVTSAVKYFGPSVLNLYLVYRVSGLMAGHKVEMAAMMAEMLRLAQQAATPQAAGQASSIPSMPDVTGSWIPSLGYLQAGIAAYALLMPLLMAAVECVPSFAKSGNALGDFPSIKEENLSHEPGELIPNKAPWLDLKGF